MDYFGGLGILVIIVLVGLIMRCPKCKTWFSFIPYSIIDEDGLPTTERVNICRKCGHEVKH